MASSNCWKLRALMQKNLNIMKRNVCGTIAEVFFPIILMILVLVIRKAFGIKNIILQKKKQMMKLLQKEGL